jgi:hypothetical protein
MILMGFIGFFAPPGLARLGVREVSMFRTIILGIALVLGACAAIERPQLSGIESPGYQYGKQMDERSLKAGFIQR